MNRFEADAQRRSKIFSHSKMEILWGIRKKVGKDGPLLEELTCDTRSNGVLLLTPPNFELSRGSEHPADRRIHWNVFRSVM